MIDWQKIQSSPPIPHLLPAKHSRSLSYYDEGFSITGLETPCYDQNSQTPRHCKPSSKPASLNGLYVFLTRSSCLFDYMGLSRTSYRLPPGPVPSVFRHPHGPVMGARMSTLRNTYRILWPCTQKIPWNAYKSSICISTQHHIGGWFRTDFHWLFLLVWRVRNHPWVSCDQDISLHDIHLGI